MCSCGVSNSFVLDTSQRLQLAVYTYLFHWEGHSRLIYEDSLCLTLFSGLYSFPYLYNFSCLLTFIPLCGITSLHIAAHAQSIA